MKNGILIKGARVLSPGDGPEEEKDILIRDGVVARIAGNIGADEAEEVIDAGGAYASPGAQTRDGGREF